MHLAVGADRGKPRILKDLAIDSDGVTVHEVRCKRRIALAERAQQLADVARFELDLRLAAGEVLEVTAEDYAGQVGSLLPRATERGEVAPPTIVIPAQAGIQTWSDISGSRLAPG